MLLPLFLKRSEDSLTCLDEHQNSISEDYILVTKEESSVSELSEVIHNVHLADINAILVDELYKKPELPTFTEDQKRWLLDILKNKKEIIENLSSDIDNIICHPSEMMYSTVLKEEHIPKIVYQVSMLKLDSVYFDKNMIWCISGLIIKNLMKNRNPNETKCFLEILKSCILLIHEEKKNQNKLRWWFPFTKKTS